MRRLPRPDYLRALPRRRVRLSKRMVALALLLLVAGLAMILSPWGPGRAVGATCAGLGLGTFFTAGYYWGCENEGCS